MRHEGWFMLPLFCGATQNLMASRNFDAAMAYRMLTEREIRVVLGGEPLKAERVRGVAGGEQGEICISGSSVGAGYLGSTGPESERFTTVEVYGEPCRLYRTGDRGYVNQDGDLVVRALGRLAEVREAAVVVSPADASGSGEAELVAFVVPAGDEFAENAGEAGDRTSG